MQRRNVPDRQHRSQTNPTFPLLGQGAKLLLGHAIPAGGAQANQQLLGGGRLRSPQRLIHRRLRIQHRIGHRTHGIFHAQNSLFPLFFHRRQFQAVLARQNVKNCNRLQSARNHIRNRVRHNHRQNNRVVPAHLQHHEHRRHRGSQKSGEQNSHPHQCIGSRRPAQMRQNHVLRSAHRRA